MTGNVLGMSLIAIGAFLYAAAIRSRGEGDITALVMFLIGCAGSAGAQLLWRTP